MIGGVAADEASRRAAQLNQLIAANPLPGGADRVVLAVSVGHAHAPSEGADLHTLFSRADARLLACKREGSGQ